MITSICFILAMAVIQTSAGYGQMPNDNCQNAIAVGEVMNLEFDTRDATFDGPGHYIYGPNIWYRYMSSCTGDVTVSLAGSDFDTELVVYNGGDCNPSSSDVIEANNNFHTSLQSQITFAAIAGHEYLIEIGGHNSAVNTGLLSISCAGQTTPSTLKDKCSNAQPGGNVTDLPFDTSNATFDGPGICMTSPNMWYKYTATCSGEATVSLLGSNYDTKLAVYDGGDCNPTSARLIECNDDFGSGYQSQITFTAVAGSQYLIEIGGYGSATGEGVLNVSCTGQPGPQPSKDDCSDAKPIGDVTDLAFDTTDATFDGPGRCMTSPNIWYIYTASCTGDATVSLLGSSYDTMLAVYKGSTCYPAASDLIECNDDAGSAYQSEITFSAVSGNQYLIEVGGYGSATGQGILNVSCSGQVVVSSKNDLGDAPDSTNNSGDVMLTSGIPAGVEAHYPTVFNDGSGLGPYGPYHVNEEMVAYLGKTITHETEADQGWDEDQVSNIIPRLPNGPNRDGGDDGVAVPLALPDCGWATIEYTVTVVQPGTDLWVNVWLDFNRDGDWDDTLTNCLAGPTPEWAVQNQFLFGLSAGEHKIRTPAFLCWHNPSGLQKIWMRITLAEQPWTGGSNPGQLGNAGSGPQAKYAIGETEDYYFTPDTTGGGEDCPLCHDVNGDGTIDIDDLAALTAQWLANCP